MMKMIGQLNIQNKIKALIESNNFPRFCLLVGDRGSGKKTLAQWFIGQELNMTTEMCGIDAESVRNAIEQAYTTVTPILYVFPDADNMSLSAKNALLKVTEEPPNNARFLMTVTSTDNVLPTILSRAFVLYMDSYTTREITQYYSEKYEVGKDEIYLVTQYCNTPGDVDLLLSYNVNDFHEYVTRVIDNIDKVSGANSFKIGAKLNLTSEGEGYDLALFWRAFSNACWWHLMEHRKYSEGIDITSKYLTELRINGLNKQFTFDNWLLDIRKAWMKYAED